MFNKIWISAVAVAGQLFLLQNHGFQGNVIAVVSKPLQDMAMVQIHTRKNKYAYIHIYVYIKIYINIYIIFNK